MMQQVTHAVINQHGNNTKITEDEMTLDEMLAAFDPRSHSGEEMNFFPIGNELL